jgi:hypothetical protein
MSNFKRKVIGEDFIVEEQQRTTMLSKNVHKEVIHRTTRKSYKLECGHKAYMHRPNAKTLHCYVCANPDSMAFKDLK